MLTLVYTHTLNLNFERNNRPRLKMLHIFYSASAYIFKGRREREEASPMGPLAQGCKTPTYMATDVCVSCLRNFLHVKLLVLRILMWFHTCVRHNPSIQKQPVPRTHVRKARSKTSQITKMIERKI